MFILNSEMKMETISSKDLFPGVYLYLEEGMSAPCDCVIISGSCVTDESQIFGETQLVNKNSYFDCFYHEKTPCN